MARQLTVAKEVQTAKAKLPIEVTLSGIFMLVRLEQNRKTLSPIDVNKGLIGSVMLVRLEQ